MQMLANPHVELPAILLLGGRRGNLRSFLAVHLFDGLPSRAEFSQGRFGRGTEGGDFRKLIEMSDPIARIVLEEADGKSIVAFQTSPLSMIFNACLT